jgi:predicted dehydrogenase
VRKIKWRIIGLGNIANKFVHTLTVMDSVKLQAVASRNKEKAEGFGKVYEVDPGKCYSRI